MINFEFISPTKIYFGKDSEKQIGEIIKSYNFSKIAFSNSKLLRLAILLPPIRTNFILYSLSSF